MNIITPQQKGCHMAIRITLHAEPFTLVNVGRPCPRMVAVGRTKAGCWCLLEVP
jgi:hypothetical protein